MLGSYWQKARQISQAARELGTKSVRQIAEATGVSKSAAHRHMKASARRNQHPESALWESSMGQLWLVRLVSATIFHFGIQRGVGAETISRFFKDLRIDTHVAVSPTAIRSQRLRIEQLIAQYEDKYQKEAIANCDILEIIGGVDETFFKDMMILLAMDLRTGYILSEKSAQNRKFDTWKEQLESAFDKMPIKVRYLVSDRAPALIKLATKHFECKSIADLFHATHKIAQTFSLPLHNKISACAKQLEKIETEISKLAINQEALVSAEGQKLEQEKRQTKTALDILKGAQLEYRQLLHNFSLVVHPYQIEVPTQVEQASTAVAQAPTAVEQAPTAVEQAPTAVAQAPTAVEQTSTAVAQAPTAVVQAPTAVEQAATAVEQAATAVEQAPRAVEQALRAVAQAPTAVAQAPTAVAQAPTAVEQAPTAVAQAPTAVAQAPTAVEQASTAVAQAPTSVQMTSTQAQQTPTQGKMISTQGKMQSTQIKVAIACTEASIPQSSESVEKQLRQIVKSLQVLGRKHQINYQKKLKSVENQLSDLACLMDLWWDWVNDSLDEVVSDPIVQQWAKNSLLAKVYWQKQVGKSTTNQIDQVYQQAYQKALSNLLADPLTATIEPQMRIKLDQWADLMVQRFCRTTSAVEGRNGTLSQLNHCRRGFKKGQLPVLTVLHNFYIRRADGTTAAERFFNQEFPDLFEWFLPQIDSLPRPRASRSSLAI